MPSHLRPLFLLAFSSVFCMGCASNPIEARPDKVQARTAQLKQSQQIVVIAVNPGSKAEKAGIQLGDTLVKYGGVALHDPEMSAQLFKESNPEETTNLALLRDGKPLIVNVPGGILGFRFRGVDPDSPSDMAKLQFLIARLKSGKPSTEPILRINTRGHEALIKALAVDFDGQYLVTGSMDKTVKIWSLPGGDLLRTLRLPIGHQREGSILAVAISPDGTQVAVSGDTGFEWDGTGAIYLFDRQSGAMTGRLSGLLNLVSDLEFLPGGDQLVVGYYSGYGLEVFDVETQLSTARDRDYGSYAGGRVWISMASDGRWVTASEDGFLRLYDGQGRLSHKAELNKDWEPYRVSMTRDGSKIAVGYHMTTALTVVSGHDLTALFSPPVKDGTGHTNGLSWSVDGNNLYWTRSSIAAISPPILRFGNGGRDAGIEFDPGIPTLELLALPTGQVAYTSFPAAVGIVSPDWKRQVVRAGVNPILRDYLDPSTAGKALRNFTVSEDGGTVQFGLTPDRGPLVRFSVKDRILTPGKKDSELKPAMKKKAGLTVRYGASGSLAGDVGKYFVGKSRKTMIEHEFDRGEGAVCHSATRELAAVASNFNLRGFNREGVNVWTVFAPTGFPAVVIAPKAPFVIAGLGNGIVRWYRAEDGEVILSLFVHAVSQEWVMWTPKGFFDASPMGRELIGYHINRGADQAADFVSIDQMYERFYRPDLVARAWSTSGHETEADPASPAAEGPSLQEILDAGLPPSLTFVSPSGGIRSQRDTEMIIKLTDQGGGYGKLVWRINGITVGVEEDGRGLVVVANGTKQEPSAGIQISKLLTLSPGENLVSVTAFNKDGGLASEPATLNLTLKDDISTQPDLHVLAVGINKYRDKTLWLNYSVPDARDFSTKLEKVGNSIFGSIHLTELFDADATREGLRLAFETIGQTARSSDVFVLYMAGHGITMDARYHFLPVDFRYRNSDSVRTGGISQDEIQKLLSLVPAQKSLVLLDTCNSGSFVEAQVVTRGIAEKTAIDKLIRATGRAVIAATSDSQVALEGYEGHGVFTYALMEALGHADQENGNRDGVTSTAEIASYLDESVPTLTYDRWGYEQVPQVNLHGREFPIGVVE